MSPRFEFDPSQSSATLETHPKGDYEVQVGEPKAFIRKNRNNEDSYGIRYPLTIKNGEREGKRAIMSRYMHSEGAQSFTKQFLMAALGYKRTQQDEKRFNEDMAGQDWSFDPETGAVGDMYRKVTGQRLVVHMDIQKSDDGSDREYQQFGDYRTLEEAAEKAEASAA